MENNVIPYLFRFLFRIRYKLFWGSLIVVLLSIYLTRFLPKIYTVNSTIYTGIVSGTSINEDSELSWNQINNTFDNIITLILSRKTIERVALHLLAQDLVHGDEKEDNRYIMADNYNKLIKYYPEFARLTDRASEKKTFDNLVAHLNENADNTLYRLLSGDHPHYSLNALNKISTKRISSSDMLQITYKSNDPGITYNSVKFLLEELRDNYEIIRFGSSHNVIKYFEEQIALIQKKLRAQEDSLLYFSTENRLINYIEQTKHLAALNKDYENRYQEVLLAAEGSGKVLQQLEKKMNIQTLLTTENTNFVKILDKISTLNSKITELEIFSSSKDSVGNTQLNEYKKQLIQAEADIAKISTNMDTYKYTKEGVSIVDMVQQWLTTFIQHNRSQAELAAMEQLRAKIDDEILHYAPLGPDLKRQEREIHVSEESYLELLHGLTLAKLKQKSIELNSTSLDVTNPPSYPIFHDSTKRLLYIIAAYIGSLVFIIGFYFLIELLDRTIRDAERAQYFSKGKVLGVFPGKSLLKYRGFNRECQRKAIRYTCNSLQDQFVKNDLTIFNFLSIDPGEGKSYIIKEMQEHWENLGFKVATLFNGLDFDVSSFDFIHSTSIRPHVPNGTKPQILLVEYPDLKSNRVPTALLHEATANLVILDANRAWKDCDQHAFNRLNQEAGDTPVFLYLNKAEREAVEEYTGQLPPYTARRRFIYNLLHFELTGRSSWEPDRSPLE